MYTGIDLSPILDSFFEESENKTVLEIQEQFCNLIVKDELEAICIEAKILLHEQKIPDLDTLSGVLLVYGWANFRLGEKQQEEEKIKYFIKARKALENAKMTKLFPSIERKNNIFYILQRIEEYLKSFEIKKLGLLQDSMDILRQLGRETEGLIFYRTNLRLELAEDPIEKAKLLIMLGQAYLDLGLPDKKKKPEDLASECWREVLSMQERGEKIYPPQILLAIMGMLGSAKIITKEATFLYRKGLKIASSKKEEDELKRFYLAAIRRSEGPKNLGLESPLF